MGCRDENFPECQRLNLLSFNILGLLVLKQSNILSNVELMIRYESKQQNKKHACIHSILILSSLIHYLASLPSTVQHNLVPESLCYA